MDIPSYLVKVGDAISWRDRGTRTEYYKRVAEQIADKVVPAWLSLDREELCGRVLASPNRSDIDMRIDEKVIVEYYSR